MSDRVPSDHDAVQSHRLHVETVGSTSRPRLPVPAGLDVADGDRLVLSLEGEPTHALASESLDGRLVVEGTFDNPRLARTAGEGVNRLRAWLGERDTGAGDPLLWDVVTPGYAYGLRRPGERVVYTAVEPPASSLADIARDLDG